MHDLTTIQRRNRDQVYKECREALAREDFELVRKIARANPDLFVQDGRERECDEGGEG